MELFSSLTPLFIETENKTTHVFTSMVFVRDINYYFLFSSKLIVFSFILVNGVRIKYNLLVSLTVSLIEWY